MHAQHSSDSWQLTVQQTVRLSHHQPDWMSESHVVCDPSRHWDACRVIPLTKPEARQNRGIPLVAVNTHPGVSPPNPPRFGSCRTRFGVPVSRLPPAPESAVCNTVEQRSTVPMHQRNTATMHLYGQPPLAPCTAVFGSRTPRGCSVDTNSLGASSHPRAPPSAR